MYPKHPAIRLATQGGTSELSNEVLHDLVCQGAAKLQALKVGPGRLSNPGLPKTGDYYTKSRKSSLEPKMSAFFLTANFDSPQFGSPLKYKDL